MERAKNTPDSTVDHRAIARGVHHIFAGSRSRAPHAASDKTVILAPGMTTHVAGTPLRQLQMERQVEGRDEIS